ncbi:MAG TPA: glycosyltransferase family 39 protein [Candidatus Eisenbacteria bacterium]|nr:glycosyltransferase family 39 protein [Candidatus Eisenbacteria bacterium]
MADRAAGRWLWIALAAGTALRLLAAWISAPVPGDDVGRLATAVRWAEAPRWLGLAGLWPPFHTYLLGGLIRLVGDPSLAARALGFVTTTLALPVFYLAVRELYGDVRRAALATLLLALYWVHVSMAGSAYAEAPYALALFAAMLFAARSARRPEGKTREALFAGLAMAVALMLRHEAKLVWLVVLVWLWREAGRGAAWRYSLPSLATLIVQLVDPGGTGRGFLEDARIVAGMKLAEVTLHGSRLEALSRWIVMPAGSPSPIVVGLGLAGLWMSRRALTSDLWAWLFAIQSAVFLALTIYPGWQPYLRYLFLYVVCLLPHAALALDSVARRRPSLAVALVALAVLIQAVAWSKGRNEDRPLGWLPVYRPAPQQVVLDRWVRDSLGTQRVLSLEGYPQAWDVYASAIGVDRGRPLAQLRSVQYDERLALAKGARLEVAGYDVVLMDPASPLFTAAWESLPPGARVGYRDPRLLIVRIGR